MPSNRAPQTIAAGNGIGTDAGFGAIAPPVHLSSTYTFEGFSRARIYDYSRAGNPTREILADTLAKLEGLGRSFRNLDDLNQQLADWLDQVANVRVHATTRRVVAEHFAEERPTLQRLPAGPFQAVLRLERRITRDGMISVGGNLYSVPDTTRRRPVEVHSTAAEVRILEDGKLVAIHPVLDGSGQRRIIAGHRSARPPANSQTPRHGPPPGRSGDVVALRPLTFYDAVGRRLAADGAAA